MYPNVSHTVHGAGDDLRDNWWRPCRVRIQGIYRCRGYGTDGERHLVLSGFARLDMHTLIAVLLMRPGFGVPCGRLVRVSRESVLVVQVCVVGVGVGMQPRYMTGGADDGAADQKDDHALHELSVWNRELRVKLGLIQLQVPQRSSV